MSKPIVGAIATASREPTPTDKNSELAAAADMATARQRAKEMQEGDRKAAAHTYFVTVRDQPERFDIYMGDVTIRGSFDRERKRVVFRVPHNLVERFSRHTLVVNGLIIPVE